MKKFIFFLIIATVVVGGAFAQADSQQNWVSGEFNFFGVGARYEYMISSNLSVGVHAYVNTLIVWNNWGISGFGRYYPWGNTFFAEIALGYGYNSGIKDYSFTYAGQKYSGNDWVGTTGFLVSPGLGWKIDVGEKGGFFLQPGIKVPVIVGKKKPIIDWTFSYDGEFGTSVGFFPYLGMGYTF
ncbi:MAG: hypothetical protein FWF38_04270 [Spirochaetaceae bacterium]|nr:hypothetical protein [Spirochaetaceae bacterium]